MEDWDIIPDFPDFGIFENPRNVEDTNPEPHPCDELWDEIEEV